MYENENPNQYENGNGNSVNNTNYTATPDTGSMGNTYRYQTGNNAGTGYTGNMTGGGGTAGGPGTPLNGMNHEKPKKLKSGMGSGKKIVIGICCGLAFGIFAGLGFTAVYTAANIVKENVKTVKEAVALPETEAEIEDKNSALTDAAVKNDSDITSIVTDVSQVVKSVMPSVVSVNNKFVEKMSYFGQTLSSEATSSGSGIIVGQNDAELLLVTNYHVVQNAEELTVQFADGSQVAAQIKGSDADKDLAVIAVQLSDISSDTMSAIAVATLGDSDSLTVGEPAIAIGNSLGYGQSVTTGVISALHRPIAVSNVDPTSQADTEVNTFIQTDAAINPGNSGGALLNIRGEVIGINSNKIGGSAVEGMGYAIPISDAKPIIEELMTKQTKLKVEEASKGYLGITGLDVVEEYSQVYGMPQGVFVSQVMEGSAAGNAGLIRGDIITAVNGEEISSMDELKAELDYYSAGTTIELTIMQGSPTGYQSKTVPVTLGSQSQQQQ